MDYEAQIAELLTKAVPLRLLDDDDERKVLLTAIVDRINALRAEQARAPKSVPIETPIEGADADERASLFAEARRLGFEPDGRWGMARLRNEVAIARNAEDTSLK
jgi:hypothetical protein